MPLVSDDILALYRDLATPTLANALDDIPFAGIMQGIGQVVPGTHAIGRAVTIRQVAGERGDFTSDDFKVGHMIDAANPGDIIVIDAEKGTLDVELPATELEKRRKAWKAPRNMYQSGVLRKYAIQVGPAYAGAVTHPGGAEEIVCYADI